MSDTPGRLFVGQGQPAVVCSWRVDSSHLYLTPVKQPDERSWTIPLAQVELSLGGFNEDQVVLKYQDLTFYADRTGLQPALLKVGYHHLTTGLTRERQRVASGRRRGVVALLLLAVLLVGAGWFAWYVTDRVVEKAADLTPVRWDVELGNLAYSAIASSSQEVTDIRILRPVQKIVEDLSRPYTDQGYVFQVHVLNSPEVNAFALPGGQIAVYTGLLKQAEGPDELAGVLAHEIQHVVNRHGLRQTYGQLRWQIALAVLVGDTSSLHGRLMSSGAFLASMAYGREMENEADREGMQLLLSRRYPAGGMLKFFKKMEAKQGGAESVMKYLATHPSSKERIENLQRLLGSSSGEGEIPVDWASLQAALRDLK